MRRYWVIRMGEGGRYVEEARKHGYVAIGWKALGDLSWLNNEGVTQDHLKKHYKDKCSDQTLMQVAIGQGQVWSFVKKIERDDIVVVPFSKKILLSKITGVYEYRLNWGDNCPYQNRRNTEWLKEVDRSDLSQRLKSSLMAWQTVFSLDVYRSEIESLITRPRLMRRRRLITVTGDELVEAIKSKLFELTPKEFEEFVSHLLGVIGFEAAATQYIADKGVDVVGTLSPEGLANIILRIQVKRVKGNISNKEVRNIRGALAHGEHGAIVTLSSFTRQAQEEAQAENKIPIALIEGDSLVDLVLKHYYELDDKYQKLIPLKKKDLPLKDIFVYIRGR